MKKDKFRLDPREVIYELKEDPLHKFKVAFALMSIIPILVCVLLILEKFFFYSIFMGRTGLILLLVIIISILGFCAGYAVISKLLKRLMLYTAKLKESDQLKSVLVANVSQEVRHPLSVVKLTLSNLLEGVAGEINKMQQGVIQRCQETIEHLIQMVRQLLDISRIEAGRFMMKRSFIDMNYLIDSELSKLVFSLKSKSLQLDKQAAAPLLRIWGDREKITQAFMIIFDNAIKHTPQNGKIAIRLSSANGDVRIEVEDTGEGIPAEKLDKIFDKFTRIAQGKELGTGLSLPIAQDIIKMHRGRILAESQIGKGSKFTVVLPKDLRGSRRRSQEQALA